MQKKSNQKVIEALYAVIEEFEENPISDFRINETCLAIISDRIETIITAMNEE